MKSILFYSLFMYSQPWFCVVAECRTWNKSDALKRLLRCLQMSILFQMCFFCFRIWIYIPLINREWGHYRGISDRVRTEWTRLINYSSYQAFLAPLLKKNTKTPEVIFHIRLCALWLSSSLILKKYLYASFSFSYWKYSCTLSLFLLFSLTRS